MFVYKHFIQHFERIISKKERDLNNIFGYFPIEISGQKGFE
jgi:hypothetical protein